MKRLLNLELTLVLVAVVSTFTGLSVLGQQQVVIDSYPPVTTVEQGESIVLVCRVVGVLPSVTLSYRWTCNGDPCEGTEVVSDNRVRIGAISNGLHGGPFRCSVTGSGVSISGTFTLTVTGGLVLSAQGMFVRDYFIPRDSFITDSSLITSGGSSAVVACRSTNPMWSYPNGTVVTNNTAVSVYQNIRNDARSDLMIGDVSTFTNGDYTCTGGSISAELGLYIMSDLPATSLGPPTNLMSGTVTATSIDVMWSGAGSPVNGYYISWRRTDLGDSATAEYARVTGATMHMLTNLFAGVTYNITVWSTDATRVSSPVSRQVTTTESAPAAPRLLRVVDSSSCQLDWLPPAQPNGAVTYTVQYQTSGSFMDLTTGLTTTHHSAVDLPSDTSVTVRVQAVNTPGTSSSNNVTLQDPRPVSPMAVLTSPNNITVSWSAPTGTTCPPIDDYIVVYNDGTGNMTVVSTSPRTLPNLQHGTTYSLFVAARIEGVSRVSVATNPSSITTLLAAPDFGIPLTNSTSVQLTWSPVTPGSVQSYRLNITEEGTQQTATVLVPGTAHVFSGLTAFTNYTVTIAAVDTMNREGVMTTRTVATAKSAPSEPSGLAVVTASGSSVTLRWDPPTVLGDTSVNYIIGYVGADTLFTTSNTIFEVTGLSPSTTFNFSVKANNSVGTSAPVYVVAMTTDVPQAVTDVSTSPTETNSSVMVSWSPADNATNGTVTGYQLTVVILGATDNTTHSNASVDGRSTTTATLTSLVPGMPYFVEVRVMESVRGLGLPGASSVFFSQETDPDPDAQVSNLNYDMNNNRLSWTPIPLFEARHFFNYTITATPSSSGTQKRQSPSLMIVPYSNCGVVCSVQPNLFPNTNYSVAVTITRSTNRGRIVPIIVLLPPTTAPTTTTPATRASQEVVIAASVGVVGGVIVAILIAVLVILCVCFLLRNKNTDYKLGRGGAAAFGVTNGNRTFNSSENLLQMSNLLSDEEREEKVREHTRTILLEDFPNYVRDMHKDRDAGFEEEYKLFRTDLVSKADVAQTHTHKNRYGNIFAYDHCRVVLKSPDEEDIDYINASYIHSYQQSNAYIATQGPIPTSIDDFWQMIWEQKSPVIVMLTKLEEGGRRKCEQYWPEDKSVPQVNDRGVKVTLVGLEHFADFDIREFHVSNEKKPEEPLLEVKHFLYTVWPDHGVPQYATSLIKFIRRVRKSYPTSKDGHPVVVHCSAGVGRSGTFISLDVMLQRMNAESNFNVFEFVTSMRKNRTFMVQTLDQYIFIHDAIEELIVCGDTSIPASSMRIKVNKLHHKLPNQDKTVFEHQFELLQLVSHKPINAQISDALADYNKPKNRSEDYIPYNLSRPRLLAMGIHNGADYINASYVDAYKEQNYFILTQSPLHNTLNEFWLMVWQAKSSCLVMLCDQGAGEPKSCVQYWPEKVKSEVLYGKVYVSFTSEEQTEGYTTRKFELVDEGKVAPPIRVTMLQYKWPEDGCPSNHKPLLKLINSAERIQQATGNNPIVVMCEDGTGLSGTFAQIFSQIERMKVEGLVDFFQSIKLARLQRAHLVNSLELYIFCHEFLLSYLDSFEGYSNFEFKPAKK